MLATQGLSRSKHSGVIATFRLHFVKPGLIETEYGDIYGRVMDDRHISDYDVEALIEGDRARADLDDARSFVDRIEQYLKGGLVMSESPSPPLSPNERQAIASFVDQLSKRYPKRILQSVLFGSTARGDSAPWSDIDVLIIVDDEAWRFQHAITTLAARVSLEHDVLIAPRVVGRERWERMKRHGFGLYQNVIDEGIPLSPAPAPS